MKKFLIIFILLSSVKIVFAQRHELGIFGGGANVIGDVGTGNYISPFPKKMKNGDVGGYHINSSIGVLYRFNFNPYMGLRFNFSHSRVGANDSKSDEDFKKERDRSFRNTIIEGSILYEYNFFDINEDQQFSHSPYIFLGMGIANYKTLSYDLNEDKDWVVGILKRKNTFVPVFGAGYKVKFNYRWMLGAEVGFRYTGKDDLDMNNPKFSARLLEESNKDPRLAEVVNKAIFGDLSSKDWYVLSGLTLTYSFGRPACYCN